MYINIEWADRDVNHLNLDYALARAYYLVTGTQLEHSAQPERVAISIFSESSEEAEGFTLSPDEDGDIEVEVYSNAKDWELTLAHELVHVAQLLAGRPLCENEAYNLEQQVKDILINGQV